MALSLSYKSVDAYEAVKEYYPNEWPQIIAEGKRYLKSIAKQFNCDEIKAYKKIISCGGSVDSNVKLFAALHEILKENETLPVLLSKLEELETGALKVSEQSNALETQENFNYEDKKILRSFYSKKGLEISEQIQEIQSKIDKHVNSISVVEPQLIIHQLDIFK